MIVALATITKANPLSYTYPAFGTTVVRSDRLGGNFAYSINQGPLAFTQVESKYVEIGGAPAYGYQFGYPVFQLPGYSLAPPYSHDQVITTPTASPTSSSDENQAEVVEAAY